MLDLFTEISRSIRRNKLRTALTGFAVAWGIFMLMVLLGASTGINNATNASMGDMPTNTMEIWPGFTSMPYDGLKEGRPIRLKAADLDILEEPSFSKYIDDVSTTLSTSGLSLVYDNKKLSDEVEGVYPLTKSMWMIRLSAGRFLNETDLKERRKVVVLSEKSVKHFMDSDEPDYESFIGERIKIGNLSFVVIGIYASRENSWGQSAYIPFTTLRETFKKGTDDIESLSFTFHGLKTEEDNEAFQERLQAAINLRHRANPTDQRTLWMENAYTRNIQIKKSTAVLQIAFWIIGLFTLVSGVVGVSNIMLISVKERTHEFGIRKAIGARPGSVVKLIIAESVSITTAFGSIGMVLGMLACELMGWYFANNKLSVMGMNVTPILDPSVSVDMALEATLVLIIAGTIAGLAPAVKAAMVRPIEALRAE